MTAQFARVRVQIEKTLRGFEETDMAGNGDSTTACRAAMGPIPSECIDYTDCRAVSWPNQLAEKLTARGIPAVCESVWGHQTGYSVFGDLTNVMLYDPRLSFGTGWTLASGHQSIAGGAFGAGTAVTEPMVFTNGAEFEKLRIACHGVGSADLNVQIDGGSTHTYSVANYLYNVITVDDPGSVATISRTTGQLYVQGLDPRTPSDPKVRIHNWGNGGRTIADMVVATNPWSWMNAAHTIAPHFQSVCMGLNETRPVAAMQADLATYIDTMLPVSSVLPVVPNPAAKFLESTWTAYADGIRAVAADRNLDIVDLTERWGFDPTGLNAMGYYGAPSIDYTHPSTASYGDIATAIMNAVL